MLTGSFVALVTLFHADGSIDHDAISAHVNRVVGAGCDGVLVAGTSGEFPALDEAERQAVAETVIAAAASRVTVAVQVGTPATASSLRLARHAAAAGADALAAVTPFYLRTDADGLRSYLTAIHEQEPSLPLLAYSIPAMTGYEYPVELIAAAHEQGVVAGVKESGEELGRLMSLRDACGPGLAILTGSPSLQAACFAHGANGSILGIANVAPAECAAVAASAQASEHAAAAAEATRLAPLARALRLGTPMAALKAAMMLRFGTSPDVRAPRRAVSADELNQLRTALEASGLALTVSAGA